ncbi:helix-turn-helix domain-containing protein [Flavivirga spongiicola]|uniref:Helix-turn-helix domain-containing protein n=1 Tax=Flavivirga spongiicola TaxID=421621 RepID=A0ABU7XT26_9FLAO|nr:helix-turn-helix transcriptional regulator [Flavivirga sp. MEBiC05379]MDO5978937.1 helix-turn-helix transcriptional regulator [Flavivirga sp. MEBiC05379]
MNVDNALNKFLIVFGKRIKKLRESKNYTLEEMDALCDIDPSDFSKIEKGKTNITFRTLIKISSGLNVNPKELLDFELEKDGFK